MIVKSVNTAELTEQLPRQTKNVKGREMAIYRIQKNKRVVPNQVMKPFARKIIKKAAAKGKTVVLAIDQTQITPEFQCLAIGVRVANRAVSAAFLVKETKGNIGFEEQKVLLDDLAATIPEGVKVMLSGDRFYGHHKLIRYCQEKDWSNLIRLKGNLTLKHEGANCRLAKFFSSRPTVLKMPKSVTVVCSHPSVHFTRKGTKSLGSLQWVAPTVGKVMDYGMRWTIEAMFSDIKSRGFSVTDTHLKHANRIERLLMLVAITFHFAVSTGMEVDPDAPKYSKKISSLPAFTLQQGNALADSCHNTMLGHSAAVEAC